MKTHLIRRDIQQLHLNMSHEHTSISKVKKLQTNLIYYLNEINKSCDKLAGNKQRRNN